MVSENLAVLTDTHCHLDFASFQDDRDEVITRARQVGLKRILNPGVDLDSSRRAVELAGQFQEVYAAVGVHPNDGASWDVESLGELEALAAHPKVVAIGEIGLDYYRNYTQPELQRRIFGQQLALAAKLRLPVIIHNRQATSDILPVLAEWTKGLGAQGSSLAERPGVLHSFSAGSEAARQAIELHFYIGITGPVTFRNAPDQQELVASLPISHLMVETDSPFLAPHPHRGRRNEPAHVRLIAEKIAELINQPYPVVAEQTSANAARLFNW